MNATTTNGLQIQTFSYNPAEFSLDHTLASGQAFRWKRRADGWWVGVVGRSVIGIRQDGDLFSWWTSHEPDNEHLIRDYFQLDVDMADIVRRVSEADPAAGEAAMRWSGLRLVRQDPEEAILSFVCSTANSVPRIAYSIGEFSRHFGEPLGEWKGAHHFTFPSAATLAEVDSDYLTKVSSLGFRGRNLVKVARQIAERGPNWALSLRDMPYRDAHGELVKLNAVSYTHLTLPTT